MHRTILVPVFIRNQQRVIYHQEVVDDATAKKRLEENPIPSNRKIIETEEGHILYAEALGQPATTATYNRYKLGDDLVSEENDAQCSKMFSEEDIALIRKERANRERKNALIIQQIEQNSNTPAAVKRIAEMTEYYRNEERVFRLQTLAIIALSVFIVAIPVILNLMVHQAKSTRELPTNSSSLEIHDIVRYELATDYFTDTAGWIGEPYDNLTNALKYFEEKTGIIPHIFFTETANEKNRPSDATIANAALLKYMELFDDENHLLLYFFDNDAVTKYHGEFIAGDNVAWMMTDDVIDAFFDYLNANYNDKTMSTVDLFANSFINMTDKVIENLQ